MKNVEENDNSNKRRIDDITISSVGSSIETRGKKKLNIKKSTDLNEKTLDPVGDVLWCRIGASLFHLPYNNLNQLNKRILLCVLHR